MAKTKNPTVFLDVAIGGGPAERMVFEVLVSFFFLQLFFHIQMRLPLCCDKILIESFSFLNLH